MRNPSVILARLAIALSLAILPAFAEDASIKAQAVVGEVMFQKAGKGDWIPLKVGAKVKQADRIKTAVESQATLAFPNGSLVTVSENALVEMKTLAIGTAGESNTKFGVKTGKLLFNIQKLANAKSSFEFESVTATAAIRGTEGDFIVGGSHTFASLLTGHLELLSRMGVKISIVGGQMALQTSQGFVVLPKPKDPHEYRRIIESFLSDSTTSTDSLVNRIQHKIDSLVRAGATMSADTTHRDTSAHGAASCTIDQYPTETVQAQLHVTGTAPDGTEVSSGNVKVTAAGGKWGIDLAWNGAQYGQKTFPVKASLGGVQSDCGTVSFNYLQQKVDLKLTLSTPNPLRVCNGPAVIAGTYVGTGARLSAKLAGQTFDLSSATGQFSRSISINDQARNWDADQLELTLANSENSISQTIALQVDRTCKDVNKTPPNLIATLQNAQCLGVVGVGAVQGDEVAVSINADGSELENFTTTSDVRGHRFTLQEGVHNYTIKATDLARNESRQDFPNVSCWPDVRFDIALDGPAREVLRIPPPPPGQSSIVTRTVSFSVRNLPHDDYGYLKRVTISKNGRTLQDLTGSQIRDVNFSVDMELERNKPNQVKIDVELQNGRIRTVTKDFDFR